MIARRSTTPFLRFTFRLSPPQSCPHHSPTTPPELDALHAIRAVAPSKLHSRARSTPPPRRASGNSPAGVGHWPRAKPSSAGPGDEAGPGWSSAETERSASTFWFVSHGRVCAEKPFSVVLVNQPFLLSDSAFNLTVLLKRDTGVEPHNSGVRINVLYFPIRLCV